MAADGILRVMEKLPKVTNRIVGSRMHHRCQDMPGNASVDIERGMRTGTLEIDADTADYRSSIMADVNFCPYCGECLERAFDYESRRRDREIATAPPRIEFIESIEVVEQLDTDGMDAR